MPDPELHHVPPVGHFEQFTIVNNSGLPTRPGSLMSASGEGFEPVVADVSGVVSGPVHTVGYQPNELAPTRAEFHIETDLFMLEGHFEVPEEAPYTILSVQVFLEEEHYDAFVWLRSTDEHDPHLVRQRMMDGL